MMILFPDARDRWNCDELRHISLKTSEIDHFSTTLSQNSVYHQNQAKHTVQRFKGKEIVGDSHSKERCDCDWFLITLSAGL